MQVYLITNKVNGKQYVGQTVKRLSSRWSEHKCSDTNTRISRTIRKHGAENFTIETLHTCETKEEMDFVEMFYIALLNTKTLNGYNITDGGEGTHGMYPSPETVEKMRQAKLGKKQTPEAVANRLKSRKENGTPWHKHSEATKKLISEKLTGPTNANFGHPHSDLHNQRIRESNLKTKPWHHGTGVAYQKYKCRCNVCVGEGSWYKRMTDASKVKAKRELNGKCTGIKSAA
jgi:group I intron endonuclease